MEFSMATIKDIDLHDENRALLGVYQPAERALPTPKQKWITIHTSDWFPFMKLVLKILQKLIDLTSLKRDLEV